MGVQEKELCLALCSTSPNLSGVGSSLPRETVTENGYKVTTERWKELFFLQRPFSQRKLSGFWERPGVLKSLGIHLVQNVRWIQPPHLPSHKMAQLSTLLDLIWEFPLVGICQGGGVWSSEQRKVPLLVAWPCVMELGSWAGLWLVSS